MICKKCGGEMEGRCYSLEQHTTWFCPICGNVEGVGSVGIQQEPVPVFGIGRKCIFCGETDEPGMRVYKEWVCPECVDVMREIVMERRKVRTEEKREEA